MKNIIVYSLISIFCWLYYFYERKREAKKKREKSMKLLFFGYDLKVLIFAIGTSILVFVMIINYVRNEM